MHEWIEPLTTAHANCWGLVVVQDSYRHNAHANCWGLVVVQDSYRHNDYHNNGK